MVRIRNKQKTKPLPGIASFPGGYFMALTRLVIKAGQEAGEFEEEARYYDPPGAKGKPQTTGEEMERRNLQRFLQILRRMEDNQEIEGHTGLLKVFKRVSASRRITVKVRRSQDYESGRMGVRSFLVAGQDYTAMMYLQQ